MLIRIEEVILEMGALKFIIFLYAIELRLSRCHLRWY